MIPVPNEGDQFTGPKRTLSLEPLEQRLLLQADWTFMVYLDGDNNLEAAALDDFLEMAHVGSTADVNIVVQLDRTPLNQTTGGFGYSNAYGDWSDTRRGTVALDDLPSATWGTSIGEVNMGDPTVLEDFINWGMTNYQADHYAVILWDHGSGYSGVEFDETSADDFLTMNELSAGLAAGLADAGVPKIDVLNFDGCLMNMVEVADQVKGVGNYMVGSEDTEPNDGLPYDQVLGSLVANPLMKPVELASTMASDYLTYYGFTGNYAVIDLQQMGPLASSLSDFATTFINQATGTDRNQLEQHWITGPIFAVLEFLDVGVLMTDIANDPLMTMPVRDAAQAVLDVYDDTVVANFSGSLSAGGSGLSIYMPGRMQTVDPAYTAGNLAFAAETQWDEFLDWWTGVPGATWTFMVYMGADTNLEPDSITDFLEMSGVGSTESVNIVVQLDRANGYDASFGNWTDTRRGLVSFGDVPDTSWGTSIGEANMGDAATLNDFVTWAMTTFPAQHYALTLWDHGGALEGAIFDDNDGSVVPGPDNLTVMEADQGLQGLPANLDILRFDACDMAVIEMAYQVRNDADYMVASEDLYWGVVSLGGLSPYDQILGQLVTNPTISPLDFANSMADLYFHSWSVGNLTVMSSVIDLSTMDALAQSVDDLAQAAMTVGTTGDRVLLNQHRVAAPFYPSDGSLGDTIIDLGTWLASVANDATISAGITSAAANALDAYNDAIFAIYAAPGTATGLAIYMPGTVPDGTYNWQNFSFADDTQWDEFLGWWAASQVTPIATFVSGSARVTFYDVFGIQDISPNNIAVKFSGANVKSITLGGSDPMQGLGIVISGATSLGTITDKRLAPGQIAFIASNVGAKSVQINSAISGEWLNGRSLGGVIFPSDIDQDGTSFDTTSLYFRGGIGKLALNGSLFGGAFINGAIATATLNNCNLFDDVLIMGNVGTMSFTGTATGMIAGRLFIKGSVSALNMPTGELLPGALLDITGSLSKASLGFVDAGSVSIFTQMDIFDGIDPRTFNFGMASFSYTPGATVRVRGGVGSVTVQQFSPGSIFYDNTVSTSVDTQPLMGIDQRYFTQFLMSNFLTPSIGTMNVVYQIDHARILVGSDLGADLLPGGTGVNADSYGVGRIGTLRVGTFPLKPNETILPISVGDTDGNVYTYGSIQDSLVIAGAFRAGVPGLDNWGGSGYNLVTLHDQRYFQDGSSIGKVIVANKIISSYNEIETQGDDLATGSPPDRPFFVPFGVGSYMIGSLNVSRVPESPATLSGVLGIGTWYRDPYVMVETPRGVGFNA